MRIAIDITPLSDNRVLSHRLRGTGFYISRLKESLATYFPEHTYHYFVRGERIPSDSDVIHIPYFEPFFITLPVYTKKPMIVTVHDLTPLVFPKHFPHGIKGAGKWLIQQYLLKKSKAIITDSLSSKKDINKLTRYKENNIKVIYLAADEAFINTLSQSLKSRIIQKYNLPKEFALYVGDVTWNKNLPRLIHAVEKTNIPLVMIGKALIEENFDKKNPWNADLKEVQRIVQNNNNIVRLGFVPTEDLVKLYNIANVCIMPSLYEGFGMPILEAMACSCPVITSNEGSLREVAGDAAIYVDAYNIESIVNGIKKVFFNEKLRKELGVKGLKQAAKFSWKKTATETMRVYEEIVNLK